MKLNKSQILNMVAGVVTILGMILASSAQEQEMKEFKEEIKTELLTKRGK